MFNRNGKEEIDNQIVGDDQEIVAYVGAAEAMTGSENDNEGYFQRVKEILAWRPEFLNKGAKPAEEENILDLSDLPTNILVVENRVNEDDEGEAPKQRFWHRLRRK